MTISSNLCKEISTVDRNILAVYLIEKDVITQWTAKPDAKLPSVDRMQTIVAQRALLFALAKAHDDFLGKIHHIAIRYDDSDIYFFDFTETTEETNSKVEGYETLPIFDKDLLIVRIKRPYSTDIFVNRISGILRHFHKGISE